MKQAVSLLVEHKKWLIENLDLNLREAKGTAISEAFLLDRGIIIDYKLKSAGRFISKMY